jgi:hypothetical protein
MRPTRRGQNRQTPYIDRGARNRLMMVLDINAQQLMSPISDWFQHLYNCEVLGLQAGQGQVYSADPWLPHDFLYNGHLMHINAAAHPVNVVVGAGHSGADYGRAQVMSDIGDLAAGLNQSTRALGITNSGSSRRPDLLVTRRRLMNMVAAQNGH